MKIKNWGRNLVFKPDQIIYPKTEQEIIQLVKKAGAANKKIRVIGTGHSWTPLVTTDDILVSMNNYQGIIEVDSISQTALVKAGTKLKLLGELLFKERLAMENLGDIDEQSIAGAISTGTHGTGIIFGTISTQIIEMSFINGKGEKITCSPKNNPAIFRAAQISLGALGIITEIRLRLVPAYNLKYEMRKGNLEETLNKLNIYKTENRNFEFYWFPHTMAVQLKFLNQVEEHPRNVGFAKSFNDVVVENGIFGLLSRISRAFPAFAPRISKICGAAISNNTFVNHSHLIFATKRLVKFYEMEYNIPAENFEAVIKEMVFSINANKYRVHFPVECRFVRGDDITISPANGRDSAYIAIHMYKGMEYERYFQAMEKIFRKYGGRPHYGKMNYFGKKDFEAAYPGWGEFMGIRQEMDPGGVFLNPYLRSILV